MERSGSGDKRLGVAERKRESTLGDDLLLYVGMKESPSERARELTSKSDKRGLGVVK
jgi:hypothetical protein